MAGVNSSQLRSNDLVSGRKVGHEQSRGMGNRVGAKERREGEAGKEENKCVFCKLTIMNLSLIIVKASRQNIICGDTLLVTRSDLLRGKYAPPPKRRPILTEESQMFSGNIRLKF